MNAMAMQWCGFQFAAVFQVPRQFDSDQVPAFGPPTFGEPDPPGLPGPKHLTGVLRPWFFHTQMLHGAGIFIYIIYITGWFMGQMFVNIPAPWSIWDNFYVFASILQQTLLWFPRKHVEHLRNPWVAKNVPLNVVSWLVARFAIVPKKHPTYSGSQQCLEGSLLWQ